MILNETDGRFASDSSGPIDGWPAMKAVYLKVSSAERPTVDMPRRTVSISSAVQLSSIAVD